MWPIGQPISRKAYMQCSVAGQGFRNFSGCLGGFASPKPSFRLCPPTTLSPCFCRNGGAHLACMAQRVGQFNSLPGIFSVGDAQARQGKDEQTPCHAKLDGRHEDHSQTCNHDHPTPNSLTSCISIESSRTKHSNVGTSTSDRFHLTSPLLRT